MKNEDSLLGNLRKDYLPILPKILEKVESLKFIKGSPAYPKQDKEEIQNLFKKTYGQPIIKGEYGSPRESKAIKVGVVFSGGQASGGHNVITGLYDALKKINPESKVFGFLGGPSGIVDNKFKELHRGELYDFRNQGGFDLIGSGRTKIETEDQLKKSLKTCFDLGLDGLVVIGGDDSNTNAAILAEYFLQNGCKTSVVGVPKTIDGDLQNEYIAISFGFDTACKVYSEIISNIERDALSAKKYYHFIKLMGRSASHIALECALKTRPNVTLIGEEVEAKKQTLKDLTNYLCDVICDRAANGKNYGVFLIPEGIIEFIPEVKNLIKELNNLLSKESVSSLAEVLNKLPPSSAETLASMPENIQKQLLMDRDPHGNVQVSLIETELLLIELTKKELSQRAKAGTYKGKFSALHHFLGYEGRAAFPSNFDSNYCYALGCVAALLVDEKATGYMCCIEKLTHPAEEWGISGIPITMLLNMEKRKGILKPVIKKALVTLDGKPFKNFAKERKRWEEEDCYRFCGPIQYFGKRELTDDVPLIL